MKKPIKKSYDLIPPQEMIQFMLKHSFFHKQVTQIPESMIVNKAIDFKIMEKAFNIEIERNDCLRLRFFKEKGKIKQNTELRTFPFLISLQTKSVSRFSARMRRSPSECLRMKPSESSSSV